MSAFNLQRCSECQSFTLSVSVESRTPPNLTQFSRQWLHMGSVTPHNGLHAVISLYYLTASAG